MTEEDYVLDLIEQLTPFLPIVATPGKAMINQFRSDEKSSIKLKKGQKLNITKCHYLGAEGGLAFACEINVKDKKQVLIASITHLRLEDTKHPLYKELRAYQLGRIEWLARNNRTSATHTFP